MDRKEAMKWTGDLDFKPGELERLVTGVPADPKVQEAEKRFFEKYAFLVEAQKKRAAQARKELGID